MECIVYVHTSTPRCSLTSVYTYAGATLAMSGENAKYHHFSSDLSMCVYGGQVCDQLLKLRDDLSPFIDEDFDAYVANMRQPHVWGGEPELSVAADVLKRPVHVYDNRLQPVTQYSPRETSDDDRIRQPIFLLFQHLGHYDLLLKHDLTARSKL